MELVHRNVKKTLRSSFTWVVIASIASVVLVLLSPGHSNAESSLANTHMDRSNTFYAYVQTGETLDAMIYKSHDGSNAADATLTVSRPGDIDIDCQVDGTAAVFPDPAGSCELVGLTATEDGIWQIEFDYAGGSNHDLYNWEIVVNDAGATAIPGRVWMEEYHIYQNANQVDDVDMEVWYQSQFGYQYNVRYLTFNGIDSVIYASNVGLVRADDPEACLPIYKSVNHQDTDYALPPDSCHAAYKLFFAEPASDLPALSTRWDGTTDWILPPIVTPSVNNLTFVSSTTGSRDGTVTFDLADYTGPLSVEVDTNNNGVYNDPEDVALPYTATAAGPQSVPFDGIDGLGDPIPTAQPIAFRVTVDRVAEIHFVGYDIEQWAGGIEVTRLNGPVGDEDVIYWDDTNFADPDSDRCPDPLNVVRDGTAGVASTGGVHGWTNVGCPSFGNANNGINGSWGDWRYINNWAFAPADVTSTYTLAAYTSPVAPPSEPDDSGGGALAETGVNPVVYAAAAVLLIASAMTIVVTKRTSILTK